jgi:hypothetical protein
MDSPFPFGFPTPTASYLALYVFTFALHQFFMHYVLAGSIYVGWCSLFPGTGTPRGEQALAIAIRDWLPFLLSAAITAGVAPLLFVQIVYPKHFYTANLLLSWKWMIVVPILIVAFYLLYLQKSRLIGRWSLAGRAMVSTITAGCFLFVGFCWTANHMLGNDEAMWPTIYETGVLNLNLGQVAARSTVWISGSFASLALFAAWQLRRNQETSSADVGRMVAMGAGGAIVSTCAAGLYWMLIQEEARALVSGAVGWPYLALAFGGVLIQLMGWLFVRRTGVLSNGALSICSVGLFCSLIGASVVREVLRLQAIEISSLYVRHAEASEIGGLSLFLIFAVINTAAIGYCVWLVRKELPAEKEPASTRR